MTTAPQRIELEHLGRVTVLRLSSGEVNALDVDLLGQVADAMAALGESGGPIVVTGSGSAFSAGVDLKRVLQDGSAYVDRLIPALARAFTAVFSYPGPTVAAINGAAIAGGCVLACACDLRILHEQAPIGANELTVGVPFPAAALEIIRHACGPAAALVILSGQIYHDEAAAVVGLAHEVTAGDVVSRAVAAAAEWPAGGAYRLAKAQLVSGVLERIRDASDEAVIEAWASPATAASVQSHLDSLRKRRSQTAG